MLLSLLYLSTLSESLNICVYKCLIIIFYLIIYKIGSQIRLESSCQLLVSATYYILLYLCRNQQLKCTTKLTSYTAEKFFFDWILIINSSTFPCFITLLLYYMVFFPVILSYLFIIFHKTKEKNFPSSFIFVLVSRF